MTRTTVEVTDEVFAVFDTVKELFVDWTQDAHREFVLQMWKLVMLQQELEQISGDAELAYTLVLTAYETVFPNGYPRIDMPKLRIGRR